MSRITPSSAAKASFLIAFAMLMTTQTFAHLPVALTDTNGDGVISAEEIREIRQSARAQMISRFDSDGDGELSRAERKAAKEAYKTARTAAFDVDRDGRLSRVERKAAKEARRAAIELQLDVNGDGEVSAAERAGFDEVKNDRPERNGKRHKRAETDHKHTDSNIDTE